jgi:hypothetical protein
MQLCKTTHSALYCFLQAAPGSNLHDIWAMFFLILSRCGTLHFLIVIKVMAILCEAAKNSLRGTTSLTLFLQNSAQNVAH